MPHVLIVKTSSLGDVIHTLPAITDALHARDDLRFDWVVEEAFSAIPAWHPGVDRVIPLALRRWRKDWKTAKQQEWPQFLERFRARRYDLIIDAQGLMKSAWLSRKAQGPIAGLSWKSAREPLASLAYGQRIAVSWDQHAVERVRHLFAQALGYSRSYELPDYGLDASRLQAPATLNECLHKGPYVVFLHATTWRTKHYPEQSWSELLSEAGKQGLRVLLPWGTAAEEQRAQRLAEGQEHACVIPKQDFNGLAALLAGSQGVISVDTGLSHLAAALDVPLLGLYGATDPARTGTLGRNQEHFAAELDCAPCLKRTCRLKPDGDPPCYDELTPQRVWERLEKRMAPLT